jgi:hypothetical protein
MDEWNMSPCGGFRGLINEFIYFLTFSPHFYDLRCTIENLARSLSEPLITLIKMITGRRGGSIITLTLVPSPV